MQIPREPTSAKEAIEGLSTYFVRQFLNEAKLGEGLGLGDGPGGSGFVDMLRDNLAQTMAKDDQVGLTRALTRDLGPALGGLDAAAATTAARAYANVGSPDPRLSSAPLQGRISSEFGLRRDPLHGGHRHHAGLDLAAPLGTPVVGAGEGTVIRAEVAGDYGNLVEVEHGDGLVTRYAHLDEIDVEVGEHIDAGQRLGTVGDSGRTTGPHLHFEVRRHGHAENPLRVVSALNGDAKRSR